MATRVIPFTVQIPAGTLPSAPVSIPLAMDNWVIERIDLEVPAGPNGTMGFQLFNNGVPWIPFGAAQWVVWNNAKDSYYLSDQPTASGWSIVGYNGGAFPHSVTIRFHVSPPSVDAGTETPVLPDFLTPSAAPAVATVL